LQSDDRLTRGGGNIIFSVTLRAIFKTETEVTLFAMSVVIFKPSLTATTKVFNQCPVGGRFPPKGVGKTQAGQKTCTGTLSLLPFGVPTSGA
ncbi:hypothetical protein AAIH60_36230, partial [Pseudomonas aeruginosa]|uniref:hypothetical protein n=1 Tax=Pseudomonas aeruginosa TaxID=287 RepID=UPI0031B78C4E